MKPPQPWDNRFFLAKLSDHEIKKTNFVVRKTSSKRPISSNKTASSQLIYQLQQTWDKCQIPQYHCAYFIQYVKDPELIHKEIQNLIINQAPIQRLIKIIKGREKCLKFLLTEDFEIFKFSELIAHLRILTINVCEAYNKWRAQLNPAVRWWEGDVDYIQKLQTDTQFLAEHFTEYSSKDIFFLWFIKLAFSKHPPEYAQYHTVNREIIRRIKECEVMILEHNYLDSKINVLSNQEAKLIQRYLNEDTHSSSSLKHSYRVQPLEPIRSATTAMDLRNTSPSNILFQVVQQFNPDDLAEFPQTLCDSEVQNASLTKFIRDGIMNGVVVHEIKGTILYIGSIKVYKLEHAQQILNYIEQQYDRIIIGGPLEQEFSKLLKAANYQQSENQYIKYIKQPINNIDFKITLSEPNNALIKYLGLTKDQNINEYFQISGNPAKFVIDDKIELELKLLSFRTVTCQGYNCFQITPETETVVSQLIQGMPVYLLATIDKNYQILISQTEILDIDFEVFQQCETDLIIPMFQQQIKTLDKYSTELSISLKESNYANNEHQFKVQEMYFSLVNENKIVFSQLISMDSFIKFEDKGIANMYRQTQLNPIFHIPLKIDSLVINVKDVECICSIDHNSIFRRWNIHGICCEQSQLNLILQELVNYILLLDQQVSEIALDFYHEHKDNAFIVNKDAQKVIQSIGFKWKQLINQDGVRFTRYVLQTKKDYINTQLAVKFNFIKLQLQEASLSIEHASSLQINNEQYLTFTNVKQSENTYQFIINEYQILVSEQEIIKNPQEWTPIDQELAIPVFTYEQRGSNFDIKLRFIYTDNYAASVTKLVILKKPFNLIVMHKERMCIETIIT